MITVDKTFARDLMNHLGLTFVNGVACLELCARHLHISLYRSLCPARTRTHAYTESRNPPPPPPSVFGPSTWADLPFPLRHKPSLDSFKPNLKTFLFPKQQNCHTFPSALLSSSPQVSVCCPFKFCANLSFV